jgi:hypothetical protein
VAGRGTHGTVNVATLIQPMSSSQYPTPHASHTFDGFEAAGNNGMKSCPLGSVSGPWHSGHMSGSGKTGRAGIADGW